jgi:hypothetical protein
MNSGGRVDAATGEHVVGDMPSLLRYSVTAEQAISAASWTISRAGR